MALRQLIDKIKHRERKPLSPRALNFIALLLGLAVIVTLAIASPYVLRIFDKPEVATAEEVTIPHLDLAPIEEAQPVPVPETPQPPQHETPQVSGLQTKDDSQEFRKRDKKRRRTHQAKPESTQHKHQRLDQTVKSTLEALRRQFYFQRKND